jgi:hypothetical protein
MDVAMSKRRNHDPPKPKVRNEQGTLEIGSCSTAHSPKINSWMHSSPEVKNNQRVTQSLIYMIQKDYMPVVLIIFNGKDCS